MKSNPQSARTLPLSWLLEVYILTNAMRHNHRTVDDVLIENRTSNGDDYDITPVEELLDGLQSSKTATQTSEGGEIYE
jgi:hypothetical protein